MDLEGRDEVWMWIAPHPGDGRAARRGRVQTRIGTGDPAHGFTAVVELRSRPQRVVGGWDHDVVDVSGRRSRDITRFVLRELPEQHLVHGGQCTIDGVRAAFDVDGRLAVGDVEDWCTIATRGAPVAGPAPRDSLRELGARILDRERRSQPSAAQVHRDRRSAAMTTRDVVDDDLEGFGGWLTATQHRTPVGDAVAEAWRVRIGRAAPAPLLPALVITCAALCHRRAIAHRPMGALDLLLE